MSNLVESSWARLESTELRSTSIKSRLKSIKLVVVSFVTKLESRFKSSTFMILVELGCMLAINGVIHVQ